MRSDDYTSLLFGLTRIFTPTSKILNIKFFPEKTKETNSCTIWYFLSVQVFSISDAMHRDLPEMRHFGGIQILSIFSKIDQYSVKRSIQWLVSL